MLAETCQPWLRVCEMRVYCEWQMQYFMNSIPSSANENSYMGCRILLSTVAYIQRQNLKSKASTFKAMSFKHMARAQISICSTSDSLTGYVMN